jgi:hypothetical protein
LQELGLLLSRENFRAARLACLPWALYLVAALQSVTIWPADLLPEGLGPRRSGRVRQRGSCSLAVLLQGLASTTRAEVLVSDLRAPAAYQLQHLFARLAGCKTQQLALAMVSQGTDLTVHAAINRHAKPVLQQLQGCPELLGGLQVRGRSRAPCRRSAAGRRDPPGVPRVRAPRCAAQRCAAPDAQRALCPAPRSCWTSAACPLSCGPACCCPAW